MDICPFIDNDKGPLELPHVLGIDTEVRLERDLDVYAWRNVDKRAARPDGSVQRGELVVAGRDHRAEVLLEELRVFLQAGVGVQEDDALCFQIIPNLMINNFRLILSSDT